jgi:hypothetical protein
MLYLYSRLWAFMACSRVKFINQQFGWRCTNLKIKCVNEVNYQNCVGLLQAGAARSVDKKTTVTTHTVGYPIGTDVHCCMCRVYVNITHPKYIAVWNVPNVFNDMFRHSWAIITDSHKIRREALKITPKHLKCKLQDRQCTYNLTLRRVRVTTVALERQCVLNINIVCLYSCFSYPSYTSHFF